MNGLSEVLGNVSDFLCWDYKKGIVGLLRFVYIVLLKLHVFIVYFY